MRRLLEVLFVVQRTPCVSKSSFSRKKHKKERKVWLWSARDAFKMYKIFVSTRTSSWKRLIFRRCLPDMSIPKTIKFLTGLTSQQNNVASLTLSDDTNILLQVKKIFSNDSNRVDPRRFDVLEPALSGFQPPWGRLLSERRLLDIRWP